MDGIHQAESEMEGAGRTKIGGNQWELARTFEKV